LHGAGNGIGRPGAEALAACLTANTTLTSLDLAGEQAVMMSFSLPSLCDTLRSSHSMPFMVHNFDWAYARCLPSHSVLQTTPVSGMQQTCLKPSTAFFRGTGGWLPATQAALRICQLSPATHQPVPGISQDAPRVSHQALRISCWLPQTNPKTSHWAP
jgi:hypothetical protein